MSIDDDIAYDDGSPPKIFEDKINHPRHYTNHPSGIECIQVTEHINGLEDLKKAAWYVNREIERLEKGGL